MTSRSKYARRRASCSSKVEDNHEDEPLRREDVAAVGDGEVEDRRDGVGVAGKGVVGDFVISIGRRWGGCCQSGGGPPRLPQGEGESDGKRKPRVTVPRATPSRKTVTVLMRVEATEMMMLKTRSRGSLERLLGVPSERTRENA